MGTEGLSYSHTSVFIPYVVKPSWLAGSVASALGAGDPGITPLLSLVKSYQLLKRWYCRCFAMRLWCYRVRSRTGWLCVKRCETPGGTSLAQGLAGFVSEAHETPGVTGLAQGLAGFVSEARETPGVRGLMKDWLTLCQTL